MADASSQSKLYEKVALEQIVGIFGMATAFSTVMSELVFFPGGSLYFSVLPSSLVTAAAMVLAFVVVSALQEKIVKIDRSPLLICEVVSLVFLIACAIVTYLRLDVASCVLSALSAIGVSCVSCTWFCWVCAQNRTKSPLIISGAIFLACLTCFIESLLDKTSCSVMIVVVYAASVCSALAMWQKGATKNMFPFISNAESDARSKILPESTIKFSIDSFMFGLVVGISALNLAQPFCFAAGCFAACVLFVDSSSQKAITERMLSAYAPPLIAASICGLFLFGGYVQIGALCLVTILFAATTCVGWMAMVGHVEMSRLSPLRIFSKARRIQYAATLLGIFAGYFLFKLSQFDWLLSVRTTVILSVVFVFVFSVLHKSRFPEIGLEDSGAVNSKSKGMWMKRCRALSEKCGLSERQGEVLILIAQGRSAKYVEQELSISLSTAQTHIRNIYRKVGVHSRQELLDEIESTKLYGED